MKGEIFESIDSTHKYLKDKILKGSVEAPYYVLALSQEAGIGTQGRTWSSPLGESFSLSLVFPQEVIIFPPVSTFFFAYAWQKFLREKEGIEVQIKWPNDLYARGRKVGGILIERIGEYYLVGIGLNLNQKKFPDSLEGRAISLYQVDGAIRKSQNLLSLFLPFLMEEIVSWKQDPLYFWPFLNEQWLYQKQWVSVVDEVQNLSWEGLFEDVSTDGALVLSQDGKILKISRGTLREKDKKLS